MYPNIYRLLNNFPRDEQQGNGISTVAMQAEYSRIAESIAQIITLIRRITTSDGKLKLDQAVRISDVVTAIDLGLGNGVTTVFALPTAIDTAVDLVRTFVAGTRTDPLTITDTSVTFAVAPAGGAAITGYVYTNLAGVIDRLQSVVEDEGASMIGISDLAGQFDATNVEDALAELASDLAALISALGDVGGYVLRDGTKTLTGQWEVNERSTTTIVPAVAVGTFSMVIQPTPGEYIRISDGALMIEFEMGASFHAGSVFVPIGATVADTRQSLVDLINASPLAVNAVLAGASFSLTNEIPRALGNVPLALSGACWTAYSGMSGGADGSFSAAYRTHYRVRNHPQSLRDGDVVVHEQLNYIIGLISATLSTFLRTDGGNQMVGILNLGGQPATNSANATTATGLTTLQQMNAAIALADAAKLSLIGTKDTVAEGTITGPVTLGRLAASVADVDQTTTPATVAVHTISGVPKPSAGDQVANKQFVDDSIAALVIGESTGFAAFDIEGDGVGGAGLVPGGDFYYDDLNITAAQALTMPIRLYCKGTFTLANTGSIISTAPVEIIAIGAIIIAGVIQCPHLTIRGGATLSISAAISCHASLGSIWKKYPDVVPSLRGYPRGTGVNIDLAYIWRAVLIETVGAISITAAITADDIFVKGGSTVVISSTFTARWLVGTATWGTDATNLLGWHDGYKDFTITSAAGRGPGGTGGTAGGAGAAGTGVSAGNSTYYGGNRPYLLENYALARGSFGGRNGPAGTPSGDAQHGRGGGRIGVYADGNMTLTAAGFFATGGDGDEIFGGGNDGGGGGGGSVRLVCKGTMVDGAIDASGGTSPDVTGGGGGLAAMIAAGYSGVQSRDVSPGAGATAGTSVAITLPAATIDGLKQQRLFEVLHDA